MDDEQDQFTQRILRRTSLKKDNEEVSSFSSLRRKLNVLREREDNNSYTEQIIDIGDVEKRKAKNTKKENKIRSKKSNNNNNNNVSRKNNCIPSSSWSKIPANYVESMNSSTLKSHESPKNLTIDEFFQKNQFREQKDENSFNSEKLRKFDKENLSPQLSDSSKNNSSMNSSKIGEKNDREPFVEWEDTVKKCINNYFENINKKSQNLDARIIDTLKTVSSPTANILSPKSNFLQKMIASSEEFLPSKNDTLNKKISISPKREISSLKSETVSSKSEFFSPKSELIFSKSEFLSPRSDFISPKTEKTEYFSLQNTDFSKNDVISPKIVTENVCEMKIIDGNLSKIPDENPTKMENSINELSLSTFVKGLGNDDWKDATDFFKSIEDDSPELVKVTCKMLEENVIDPEIVIPTADIKIASLPFAESISKNLEKLNETQSENESTLDLSAIIDNLDEEIKNLEIRPEAMKIANSIDPPRKFKILPKPVYTPRKLFHKSIEESEEEYLDIDHEIFAENGEKSTEIEKNRELNVKEEKNEEQEKEKSKEKNEESNENEKNKSKEIDKSTMNESTRPESAKKKWKLKKRNKETKSPMEMEKSPKIENDENSNFVRRNSSFFRFKKSMPWRSKPNLESTRESPNCDLEKKTTSSPSQVESTISSINPNSPTNPEEKKSQLMSDCSMSFEVEKFLEEALGEELYSTSITYGFDNTKDKTNSNLDASELMSGDRTSLNSWILNSPRSENRRFSRHSTLNRTIGAYKSLSKRIKKKFRPSLKETVKQAWNPILSISSELNEKLQPLIQEVNIQQTRIYQASKALDYCRSMKMFQASPEQVESDRLLLIATLKKQAIFHEIKAITSGTKVETACTQQATIIVDNFALTLKNAFMPGERPKNIVEWFVIVVSQGLTVWSTQAVICPADSTKITFPGSIAIPNLNPDFKIHVRVFGTKIFNILNAETIHGKEMERQTSCPSPTKFLKRSERSGSVKNHEVKFSGVRETSFTLQGYVELQVHDLSLYPPWPLMLVPKNSSLHNSIDLTVTSQLEINVNHAGFLNYGDEMGGFAVWNRRWCVLEKHMLMFWNYPREQEVKPPLLTINLMDCLNDRVTTISRTLCARPRTFVIEVSRQRNVNDRNSGVMEIRASRTIVKHLLQCDSLTDLMVWKEKLNHILAVFREWNVKGHSYPMESALFK